MINILFSAIGASAGALITHKLKKDKYIKNNRFSYKFADLLENNIISTEKIHKQFEKADLDDEFTNMAEVFFDEYFLEDIKNLKIKDISVFEDFYFGVKESIQMMISQNMTEHSNVNLLDIEASEIFADEQKKYMAEQLAKNFAVFFDNTDAVKASGEKILDSMSEIKLGDLISNDMFEAISKNIDKYSKKLPDIIKQKYDNKLDELIVDSLDKIDLDKIINEINNKISKERLYVALGINKNECINQIVKDLFDYFSTDYGKNMFIEACEGISSYLQYSKKSLYDVVDESFESEIRAVVHKYEDGIIDELIKWQESIDLEVERGLKKSTNKLIDDEALSDKILGSLIDEYKKEKNSDKYVKLLKESYNDIDENDRVDNYIINEVSGKFSKILFNEFINDLDKLSPENIYKHFIGDLQKEGTSISKKIFDDFLNKRVHEIINIDLLKIFKDRYRYVFVDYVKDKIFYNPTTYNQLGKDLYESLYTLKNKPFKEIFPKSSLESFTNIVKIEVADGFLNDESYKEKIYNGLSKFFENKNVGDFYNLFYESDLAAEKFMSENFNSLLNLMFNKNYDILKNYRVEDISKRIDCKGKKCKNSAFVFRKIMSKALRSMSKGFVYLKTYDYFEKKDKKDFDDFYGEISAYDSKKLNILSILSSTGIAAAFSFIYLLASKISYGFGPANGIFLLVSFAVGSLFNLFLIDGIYLKKTKKSIKGFRAKYNFENRMRKLIEEGVKALESQENSIIGRDDSQVNKIKYDIKESLLANECETIADFINKNEETITDSFLSIFINFLSSEKENIIAKYYADMISLKIKDMFNRKNILVISDEIDKDKKNNISKYIDEILQILATKKSGDFDFANIRQDIIDRFDENIYHNYNNLFDDFVSPSDLGKYFDRNSRMKLEEGESLRSIFSQDSIDNLEGIIYNNIYYDLFSDKNMKYIASLGSERVYAKYFSNKKIENFLSRRAKIMITSMFYKLFADTVHSARKELASKSEESVLQISKDLFLKLNNREAKKFEKYGAEKLIENILDDFYRNELEKIFKENLERLYEPAKAYTINILNLKSEDIKLKVSEDKFLDNIREIIIKKDGQALVYTKYGSLFSKYFSYIIDHKYVDYKRYLFDFKIRKFMTYHKRDFKNGLKKVSSFYINKKSELLENTISLRKDMYNSIIDNISMKELFKSNSKLRDEFYDKLKVVDEDCDFINLAVITLYNSMYQYLEDMDILKSFVDSEDILYRLSSVYDRIFDANKIKNIFEIAMKKTFKEQVPLEIISKFDEKTRTYLLDMIVDELYLNINDYMDEIYQDLNINKIIENDLNLISREEFENLFEYQDLDLQI